MGNFAGEVEEEEIWMASLYDTVEPSIHLTPCAGCRLCWVVLEGFCWAGVQVLDWEWRTRNQVLVGRTVVVLAVRLVW